MKHLAAIALLLSCGIAAAAIVDMPFVDAGGTQYSTGSYRTEIQKRFPGTQPLLLLVVTTGPDEPEFKKQMEVLKSLDSETLQLLVVVGSATSEEKHSYWLASEDAGALLEGGDRFILMAIGNGGDVCFSSTRAITRKQIVASNNALQPTFSRCARKRL